MKVSLNPFAFLLPLMLWGLLQYPVSAKSGYPEFSWERVPVYAHVGVDNTGLSDPQCKFLADHFNFITLTGGVWRGDKKNTAEARIAEGARKIKQHNPNAKVLFYWAPDYPKHQWMISNASFPEDGYLVWKERDGREILQFDLNKREVRDWWIDVAAKAVHEYSCDGIFIDGITTGRVGGTLSKRFGKEKAAEIDKAMYEMIKDARKKMGSDKLLIFNPIHGHDETKPPFGIEYISVTDGAMVDDFDRATNNRRQSKEYVYNTIMTMSEQAKNGKIVIFKAWPGFAWWSDPEMMKKPAEEIHKIAQERIEYRLACFLVGAEENTFFCYTWGWRKEYGTFFWYPELEKPLGPPKGDAVREGWKLRREFERASVFVDLEGRTGRIDWKSAE